LVIYLANNSNLIAVATDLGKTIYVEKVRAAEMLVTRWFAGPNLARIDDDLTEESDHHVAGGDSLVQTLVKNGA